MAKYDIETWLYQLQAFWVANFATRLTAISAEKNDGVALPAPNAAAFYVQSMNLAENAYDPYVYMGVVNVKADSAMAGTAKTYEVHVMVLLADEGGNPNMVRTMLRYLRAFEELCNENYDQIGGGYKIKVQSLVPVPITSLNSADSYRATGVAIEVTIP
jgi:hypothetical protein